MLGSGPNPNNPHPSTPENNLWEPLPVTLIHTQGKVACHLPHGLSFCNLLIPGKSLKVMDKTLLCLFPDAIHTLLSDITPSHTRVLIWPYVFHQHCASVFLICNNNQGQVPPSTVALKSCYNSFIHWLNQRNSVWRKKHNLDIRMTIISKKGCLGVLSTISHNLKGVLSSE